MRCTASCAAVRAISHTPTALGREYQPVQLQQQLPSVSPGGRLLLLPLRSGLAQLLHAPLQRASAVRDRPQHCLLLLLRRPLRAGGLHGQSQRACGTAWWQGLVALEVREHGIHSSNEGQY
jgi:hypothetical protein